MNEFEKNRIPRLEEFRNKLNELYDEYHAEVYLNDAIFKKYMELGNEIYKEILEVKGIRLSK